MTSAKTEANRWTDKLFVPVATLLVNSAMTYGVVSTQLQWLRSDLTRQQQQIDRLETRLFERAK
jgi:hypothetical protein